MADIKPIKPIKLCVNITIPTIDDDSISLYECVGILGNKLQEAIQKINESLGSLEGAYTADNPPPYPVTSVNGKTGAVVIDIPANVYTEDNPPPYPVTSVNRAETKDVITVFEPEGGSIEDVSQEELIAACKAGARLGAFNQDDGTCRLYHFNLYIDPERVDYNEVAGGGASGVISVNDQTGAVNIFNAPISAATAESVTALNTSTNTKISQLKNDISDAWASGTTYAVGDYCISGNQLYKCKTAHTAWSSFNSGYWDAVNIAGEVKNKVGLNHFAVYPFERGTTCKIEMDTRYGDSAIIFGCSGDNEGILLVYGNGYLGKLHVPSNIDVIAPSSEDGYMSITITNTNGGPGYIGAIAIINNVTITHV